MEPTKMVRVIFEKLGYSLTGVLETWRTELSFRQWFCLALGSDLAALLVSPNIMFTTLVVAFGFLILGAELINTAVEAIVDKTTPEIHKLAKKSKDAASAMTFVTFLGLVSVWAGIFISIIGNK